MFESVVEVSEARAAGPAGRTFMVVVCGGGDRPIAALGGQTPFEAALTPHLDALADRGCSGLLQIIADDIPPESDSGAMALFGYDPLVHYTGRGPLEGFGMDFWRSDGYSVAFRINFGSWDPATGRLDRRTSRDLSDPELSVLVAEILDKVVLSEDVSIRLTGFGNHRGVLALTSLALPLTGRVSNTDPGFVNQGAFGVPATDSSGSPLPCHPLVTGEDAAVTTARLVNEFVQKSAEVLEQSPINDARLVRGQLPANIVLLRDGGDALPVLSPFPGRLSLYGQVPAERGLAMLIGARFTAARKAPDQDDEDYYSRLVQLLAAEESDVVFVHLKGADEPAHDRRPDDKVAAITTIDALFVGPLMRALSPADTLIVTCDHATPCELGIHAGDRVPTVVMGPGVTPDSVDVFGERAATAGALPIARASDLLTWLGALPGRSRT